MSILDLAFFRLMFAAFALAVMASDPTIEGPLAVFALIRFVLGQLAVRLDKWGGWLLRGLTCIVCWSPWCALFVYGLDGLGMVGHVAVTILSIAGAVIALERATDRGGARPVGPTAAKTGGCTNCGNKAQPAPAPAPEPEEPPAAPVVLGVGRKTSHRAGPAPATNGGAE